MQCKIISPLFCFERANSLDQLTALIGKIRQGRHACQGATGGQGLAVCDMDRVVVDLLAACCVSICAGLCVDAYACSHGEVLCRHALKLALVLVIVPMITWVSGQALSPASWHTPCAMTSPHAQPFKPAFCFEVIQL